jgi:glycosyltransferase involved in cell wall biosynthesis
MGLLVARLMNVPAVGIYHSDFAAQAIRLTENESVVDAIETYSKWFYSMMDTVLVPTEEYMDILEARGLDRSKMRHFFRGVDTEAFFPKPIGETEFCAKYGVEPGVNLLYVGRISKDKNLDFLLKVYRGLLAEREDINLIIAGTGPFMADLERRLPVFPRLRLLGRVEQRELPELYSSSDFFIFPSTTDTYGMAVAEALACGVPVVVSDAGGPQELFNTGKAGLVLPADDLEAWIEGIGDMIKETTINPLLHLEMQVAARQSAEQRTDWEQFLDEIINDRPEPVRQLTMV